MNQAEHLFQVIRVIEFIKCYGRDLHNSTQLDSMWTSFLADPTCSEPLANNDLYPLIQTVTIIQPTLPSPCGFARLLWVLTRPDMYNHMSCNLFDRNGSESPHIQVVWVIDLQDVKAMTFGNSEYLTVTNYVSEPNFFENRLQELLARTKAVTHPEPNLIDNTSTISLPPSVAEQPHKDLTGQVTKSSGLYIGYGDLSDIYRGEWKNPATGQTTAVAIKLIRGVYTQQEDWKKISRHLNHETWVWDQLSDLNVLPFLGISNDAGEDGNAPALITPLCTNGHVLSYLTKNPDADRLKLAVGTAKGLRYLHSKGVIHGDLKPTNILISNDGEALLGDFGRSRIMRHRGSTTLALGANGYQAPELISARGTTDDGGPSNESYTDREIFCNRLSTKTDVYAFAMVALEIFTGKSPFYYIMNDFQRATRIKRGDQLQREKYYSVLLTDARWGLLAECWVKNNVARPEVDMILSQLM